MADSNLEPQEEKTPELVVDAVEESTKESTPAKKTLKDHIKTHHRFKTWYSSHLKLAIPLTVLLVILLIVSVPLLRYNVVGLVLKKNFTLQVIDSETKSPVSGASVSSGSLTATTDGNGKTTLHAKVGHHAVMIVKKYYHDQTAKVTTPILSQKSIPQISLTATGRQVKITVVNTISKKPVAKANIKVADITAQTDSAGLAMIVLPPGVHEQKATLSGGGYNDSSVTIKVSDSTVAENNFTITPTGKIYFLSKRTGKINVMKSNLDGTEQSVVLAGTGTEDDTDTILLASRDWKYLAFKSKRDNSPAKLYYIDTSVDKLNTLDEGNADFTLIGWAGDTFVYQVNRNGLSAWQPKQSALKSFNAPTGKLVLLNETDAAGTDANYYANEYYGSNYIIDSTLIFTKTWNHNYSSPHPAFDKQAKIFSISVDGTNAKTLQPFDFPDTYAAHVYFSSILYEPKEIYFQVDYGDQSSSTTYYKYQNGSITNDNALAAAYEKAQTQAYPTYLLSPSGKQTFWVEPRDGKNSLLVGDQDGQNSKVVAAISSDFLNYGWYSDDYLFVSKKSSELYVMSSSGVKAESDLIKITDYHKPAYFFYGYGGGYGGL